MVQHDQGDVPYGPGARLLRQLQRFGYPAPRLEHARPSGEVRGIELDPGDIDRGLDEIEARWSHNLEKQ
jgi:hypothetical protein